MEPEYKTARIYKNNPAAPVRSIRKTGPVLFLRRSSMDNRKRITDPVSISGCRFSSELPVKVKSRMVTAAETTRPREADLRPFSISVTYRDFLYRPNRQYRVTDRQMPEMTQPRVARTAPGSPAIRTPTKVEVLTAKGPGVSCEIVIISVKIFWEI